MADFDLNTGPSLPPKTDYGIGCIGAGFIMRDIHLVAYREAGFNPVAIASRTPEHARAAAEQNGVGTVYDTWQELLDDERVEIVDIAYPPDQQLEIVRAAAKRPHVKGILAQKPVAFTLDEAVEMVRVCDEAGVKLGVNHNMRYDQSMRALRTLLDRGELGEPVVAEIVMNARPHWQEFVKPYGRIALLNMSIHHLDAFRFLFGDPDRMQRFEREARAAWRTSPIRGRARLASPVRRWAKLRLTPLKIIPWRSSFSRDQARAVSRLVLAPSKLPSRSSR